MDNDRSLWTTRAFRFSKQEVIIAPLFREWLSVQMSSKLGRFLADVEFASEAEEFSKEDVRGLEKLIGAASKTKAAALPWLNLLSKVVYGVNHTLQFSIPQPRLATHLTPLKNPHAAPADVPTAHRSVEAWLDVEKCWLKDLHDKGKTERKRIVPFDLILLSAALHSGILSHDLAIGLNMALSEQENFLRHSGHRVYMDLPVAWLGRPRMELRRWYPDDGVACLIARYNPATSPVRVQFSAEYADVREQFCRETVARIRHELSLRHVEKSLLPESLSDVFGRIALFLRSEIPAVFVQYATQKNPARSLLPLNIGSVYGDPAGDQTASEIEAEDSPDAEWVETESGEDQEEPDWMLGIRECFRKKHCSTVREKFASLEMKSPTGRRIIGFARHLLRRGSSSGNALHLSSIRCCVLTVGRLLGPLLEERDPAELGESAQKIGLSPADVRVEMLEDLYVRAIESSARNSDCPEHLQATAAWALREFHAYLVANRLAGPVNEADIFRVARGFPPVDAMIVSVDDVFRALRYLRYEPNPAWSDDIREAAELALILGFFAGPRTMEGLGADINHFPGGESLPFLVLPSIDRELKTPNAPRMIPVATFMKPFQQFIQQATTWTHSSRGPRDKSDAHTARGKLFKGCSEELIVGLVGAALRAATGNEKLHYYSLRHSFASWTLTRLLLSDLPEIPVLFPHLPETTKWLQESKSFRLALYGNDRVENDHAWAVAVLMGHSQPGISFASYCHTLDILTTEILRNSAGLESAWSLRERVRTSSSRGRTAGYKHLPALASPAPEHAISTWNNEKRPSDNCTPDRDQERMFALHDVRVRLPHLHSSLPPTPSFHAKSWMEQTWGLLHMYGRSDRDFGELVDYLGLETLEARRIIHRSRQLCGFKSETSGKELHAVQGVTVQTESGIAVIRYPEGIAKSAMEIAAKLAKRIDRIIQDDADRAAGVLGYWAENAIPGSGSVAFPAVNGFPNRNILDRINDYRWFLGVLKLGQSRLSFEGACGTDRRFPPTNWYSRWKLTARGKKFKVRNLSKRKAKQIAPGEWLAIGPKSACPNDEDFDRAYRDAFCFVMLLASIRFGLSPA